MAIINQRWPRDLAPETCRFGRSRNDVRQTSPISRQAKLIRRGRPLWSAECTWLLGNDDRLAKLRYWLESLDGFSGSVQIWNFASPYPQGLNVPGVGSKLDTRWTWTNAATPYLWNGGGLPNYWALGATVTLSAAASVGATAVSFTGQPVSSLFAIQGQYIQIGRRLYLVAATVSTDGAGAVTVQLQSGLLAASAAGDIARLVEAGCEMQLVSQMIDETARAADGLISVSASFIETVTDLS